MTGIGAPDESRSTCRVAVLGRRRLVVELLQDALAAHSDISVVGCVETPSQLALLMQRTVADVAVVTEAAIETGEPGAVVRVLRERGVERIVVLLERQDPARAAIEITAGCMAVIDFTQHVGGLRDTVMAVARGECRFSLDHVAAMLDRKAGEADQSMTLTKRENEILQLLADGLTTDAISKRLFLSPHTVRNHIRNAIHKLGCTTRVQAILTAVERRLITVESAA